MVPITFPGDLAPGPVPVTVSVPDDWMIAPAPDVAFVAVGPVAPDSADTPDTPDTPSSGDDGDGDSDDAPAGASLVLSVRRVDDAPLSEFVEAIREELAELPGYDETGSVETDVQDRPAVVLHRTFREREHTLVQRQLVCKVTLRDEVADLVVLTLTRTSVATLDEELIEAIFSSVTLGDPDAT